MNISGNIAAARAAAALIGVDMDLTTYLSDLVDRREQDELKCLLESLGEALAPTAETKAQLEEALATGENQTTAGGTSAVPSKRRGDGGDSDDDQPRAKETRTSARQGVGAKIGVNE